jgi:hypothetical protein
LIDGIDLTGAITIVVADPVDIDTVVGGIGIDLEINALAVIDRELCGESLDAAVARTDQPLALGRPCFMFSSTIALGVTAAAVRAVWVSVLRRDGADDCCVPSGVGVRRVSIKGSGLKPLASAAVSVGL